MDHRAILDTAATILAERGEAYGGIEQSFDLAAKFASLLGVEIDATGVSTVLMAVKLARIARNPTHFDSHVDLINYTAFRAEFVGAGQNNTGDKHHG
ncbi:DUF6378 domain-containing protein [Segnochrobactraceae bacterium EtOH-i3]